jgi:hypothetical protein
MKTLLNNAELMDLRAFQAADDNHWIENSIVTGI